MSRAGSGKGMMERPELREVKRVGESTDLGMPGLDEEYMDLGVSLRGMSPRSK